MAEGMNAVRGPYPHAMRDDEQPSNAIWALTWVATPISVYALAYVVTRLTQGLVWDGHRVIHHGSFMPDWREILFLPWSLLEALIRNALGLW